MHVRGLSSLGIASDEYGGLLIPVIMAKLPSEIRVRIARETKGSVCIVRVPRTVDIVEVGIINQFVLEPFRMYNHHAHH